ncbi:MAG: 30S ribosomal protein S17 [Dehalococcoidales bacterium]|jgi:small subunit ribosomal protein S17|nr:30S ribosomal protein S17 [Dehalococcoidales bacterium]
MENEAKAKTMIGTVVSDKMDKTIVVAVEKTKMHPLYRKTFKKVLKYKAHDEKNECKVGDKVRIIACRPFSKEVTWRLDEIMTKAVAVDVKPEEVE